MQAQVKKCKDQGFTVVRDKEAGTIGVKDGEHEVLSAMNMGRVGA